MFILFYFKLKAQNKTTNIVQKWAVVILTQAQSKPCPVWFLSLCCHFPFKKKLRALNLRVQCRRLSFNNHPTPSTLLPHLPTPHPRLSEKHRRPQAEKRSGNLKTPSGVVAESKNVQGPPSVPQFLTPPALLSRVPHPYPHPTRPILPLSLSLPPSRHARSALLGDNKRQTVRCRHRPEGSRCIITSIWPIVFVARRTWPPRARCHWHFKQHVHFVAVQRPLSVQYGARRGEGVIVATTKP